MQCVSRRSSICLLRHVPTVALRWCSTGNDSHLEDVNREAPFHRSREVLTSLLPASLQNEFCPTNLHLTNRKGPQRKSDDETTSLPVVPIAATSQRPVRWQCQQCRFQWTARVAARVAGRSGCPRCESERSSAFSTIIGGSSSSSSNTASSMAATSLSSSSSSSALPMLAEHYPHLAASWMGSSSNNDRQRRAPPPQQQRFETQEPNHRNHNDDVEVCHLTVNSTTPTWWECIECSRAWKESPASRVATYHSLRKQVPSDKTLCCVCPYCQERHALLQSAEPTMIQRRRWETVQDHPVLKKEFRKISGSIPSSSPSTQKNPSDDEAAHVKLTSRQRVLWRCLRCEHEHVKPVDDRAQRGEGCPNCAAALRVLEVRADVAREFAATVPTHAQQRFTVQDSQVVTFVCRRCVMPYKMSLRERCLLPPDSIACPKCRLADVHRLQDHGMEQDGGGGNRTESRTMRHMRRGKTKHVLQIAAHRIRRNDALLRN